MCLFVFTSAALCASASFPVFLFVFGFFVCVGERSCACATTESLILSDGPESGYGFTGHHGSLSLLRLIQLNPVNNWSHGETEARPRGMRMTSWGKAMETEAPVSSPLKTHLTGNRFNRDDKMSSSQKWNRSWSELRTENPIWFLNTCSGLILTVWKQCYQCGFDGHTASFLVKKT